MGILIHNPAPYDSRRYGCIAKDDVEKARRTLTPEAFVSFVVMAMNQDGFNWKRPDISGKSIRELSVKGYMQKRGDDWLFDTEGNFPIRESEIISHEPPPDPKMERQESDNAPYTVVQDEHVSPWDEESDELPF